MTGSVEDSFARLVAGEGVGEAGFEAGSDGGRGISVGGVGRATLLVAVGVV